LRASKTKRLGGLYAESKHISSMTTYHGEKDLIGEVGGHSSNIGRKMKLPSTRVTVSGP